MTNHYIYFPAGWTRRPKLNIPESINKRISDEKNRAILSRVFKRIGRELYPRVGFFFCAQSKNAVYVLCQSQ